MPWTLDLQSPDTTATTLGNHPVTAKRRRHHRKSKTSCLDCRRRRVKCDEQQPSCRSCTRRGVTCRYTGEDQLRPSDATANDAPNWRRESNSASLPPSHEEASPSFPTAPLPVQTCNPLPIEPSACLSAPSVLSDESNPLRPTSTSIFSLSDLALLHHWTLSTSLSICRGSGSFDFWQRMFPEIGFEHPFVTHAIMSLAALHLAHIHTQTNGARDEPNVAKAAEHHNHGLRGFRQSVANITEGNSEALFVWSLLNMIYVFGLSARHNTIVEDRASQHHLYKDLVLGIEWLPMIRGIEAVLNPTHNYLRFGRMQKIMSVGNWYDLEPGPIESERLDSHLCRTRETWKNSNDVETYDETLNILRKCRKFIQQFDTMDAATLAGWGYNRSWSGPLMFIHFAPQAYFTLLHQRQPPALVLFAYFGALLHGIRDYWFMEGWGKEIVEVVDDLLGTYWRPWISWPLESVGLG